MYNGYGELDRNGEYIEYNYDREHRVCWN